MMDALVLVLADEHDRQADEVCDEITRKGAEVVRWDTGMFPMHSSLVAELGDQKWQTVIEWDKGILRLHEVTSVWYRRPTQFTTSTLLGKIERQFARREAVAAFSGLFQAMERATWVNPIAASSVADIKLNQLRMARHVGFAIPTTLITNEPEAARRFRDSHTDVVLKTLTRLSFNEPEGISSSYTTLVETADLQLDDRVRHTPCLFQAYIPKAVELRITVIGSQAYAAEIHSQSSEAGRIDFRLGYADLTYGRHELPAVVERQLHRLMDLLGLKFGAIDLILTPSGEYVFLEINSAGQFGWIEKETGFPLVSELAKLLIEPNKTAVGT